MLGHDTVIVQGRAGYRVAGPSFQTCCMQSVSWAAVRSKVNAGEACIAQEVGRGVEGGGGGGGGGGAGQLKKDWGSSPKARLQPETNSASSPPLYAFSGCGIIQDPISRLSLPAFIRQLLH